MLEFTGGGIPSRLSLSQQRLGFSRRGSVRLYPATSRRVHPELPYRKKGQRRVIGLTGRVLNSFQVYALMKDRCAVSNPRLRGMWSESLILCGSVAVWFQKEMDGASALNLGGGECRGF
jgi:hypothetical protein